MWLQPGSLQGREFAELDILGLASVGLSTKVGRTIGFMGVGFKAVYKRFDRVEIRDSQRFSFAFERPQRQADKQSLRPEDSHSFAWVLLPRWCDTPQLSVPFDRGCLFLLERPRGGLNSVRRDLGMLPSSTIPLLGHTVSVFCWLASRPPFIRALSLRPGRVTRALSQVCRAHSTVAGVRTPHAGGGLPWQRASL